MVKLLAVMVKLVEPSSKLETGIKLQQLSAENICI